MEAVAPASYHPSGRSVKMTCELRVLFAPRRATRAHLSGKELLTNRMHRQDFYTNERTSFVADLLEYGTSGVSQLVERWWYE